MEPTLPMLSDPADDREPAVCSGCGRPADRQWGESLCTACLLLAGLEEDKGDDQIDHLELARLATLLPQYLFEGVIGQGGTSTVYLVHERDGERPMAMKVFAPGAARPDQDRFPREAAAMARLKHPGIVGFEGSGQVHGTWYLLLEYVEGTSLRSLIRPGGIPMGEAVALVCAVADALASAHAVGLVHRDIKPENILVGADGKPRLTDFGLARDLSGKLDTQTASSAIGTPSYMAPERFTAGAVVDARTDVFSLGVVLYELLTGDLPIGHFAAPSKRGVGDSRLDAVVFRALAPDPARRFPSARDFADALAAVMLPSRRPRTALIAVGVFLLAASLIGISAGSAPLTAAQDVIRRHFMQKISELEKINLEFNAKDEPLRAVLQRLSDRAGTKYRLFPGIGDARTSCQFREASVNEIHAGIFSGLGLVTSMREDGLIVVYRQPFSSPQRKVSAAERRARAAEMSGEKVPSPGKPVLFSLDMPVATLREAMEEIGRQTGYEFQIPDGLCSESGKFVYTDMPADAGFQIVLAKYRYTWKELNDGRLELLSLPPNQTAFEMIEPSHK